MNFIMIGLLREALDRLCVRLNMYLVYANNYLFDWLEPVWRVVFFLTHCHDVWIFFILRLYFSQFLLKIKSAYCDYMQYVMMSLY